MTDIGACIQGAWRPCPRYGSLARCGNVMPRKPAFFRYVRRRSYADWNYERSPSVTSGVNFT
jgi:hypothetical protein